MLLVTGATGAIGRSILPRVQAGLAHVPGLEPMVLAVRDVPRARALFRGTSLAALDMLACDLAEEAGLKPLAGLPFTHMLHLAALLGSGSRHANQRVNVEGTRRLLALAVKQGAQRFLFFSSDLADSTSKTPYARSKREAEGLVHDAALSTTILRPKLVMGPRLDGPKSGFYTLVDLTRAPIVPVWDASLRIAPLFADDLADIVLRCLAGVGAGQTWSLAGESLNLGSFFEQVATCHARRADLLALPAARLEPALRLLGDASRVLLQRDPPWSILVEERRVQPFSALEGLDLQPTPFADALRRCLLPVARPQAQEGPGPRCPGR